MQLKFTYIGLLTAMLLWSSSFPALKLAFRSYDPFFAIWGRLFVASLIFLPAMPRLLRKARYRHGDLKYILLMAIFEPCLYFIFEAKALENTSASQAGMITAMLPVLVAVTAHFYLKEQIKPRTVIGFSLAVFGACWLSLEGAPTLDAPRPAFGNLLEFMAMVCATGYTISVKKLTSRYSPFLLTAVQAYVGCGFFLLILLMGGGRWPQTIEPLGAASIIYLGAFVSIGAYGLYNWGVSRIPANQASIFVNLIPVFTVILGWLVLNEKFTPMQYPASAIVLLGVFMSQDHIGRRAASSDHPPLDKNGS